MIATTAPTRYEVTYIDADGSTTVIGYIARRSARGMLEYIQGSAKAQAIIEAMAETVEVSRTPAHGWSITDDGKLVGVFAFSGRTEREVKNHR